MDYLQSSHSGRSPFFLSRKKTKAHDKARQFGDLHAEEISKNFTAEIVEATDFGVFSIDTIPVPQEVCKLYIYAANQEKIEEFFKELTNFVDEHLMEICKKHKVEVSMDTVITVKGMSKDVQLMEKEIQSILKEIESKQQASRIAGLVCWYTLEVTATGKWRVPFNERENLMTEDAYQKNEGTVEFAHANGTVYVVNLKEMTRSSKIERIQNPELYKQYLARKTQMDKQNNGMQSEKTLWHGTSSNAIENINLHGFDRGFCGKNATRYGLGVYFAVNSWYSMQRHLLYQRLRWIKTHVPVQGPGRVLNKRVRWLESLADKAWKLVQYDSATDNELNPSMYVIFHDSQAYPEYLITFR
ncbi:hypothetical protein C0Q70_08774 [Pomacea canaliculata]|uniref:Poly [ADP-ribose] polymerase n=1 Tax=Pomacea canaliculata TaxID=400727 RepID=A0A2T7P7Z2_POMCA|nr:hypothetical protein C0Q70_08774 [Pomacea canaliculata]